ncbi:MAG: 3-isopropylmalate dehydratase small subunit [Candidatus Poribacteria bacterium]|nr:3-isopropylmalate dehydratase small subunit [Candidatus Poribacteria bacterium]
MEPFPEHIGLCVPLDRVNVDTDQIIPKQFLKRIERTGFGEFLFYDWRYYDDGSTNPDFILNHDQYKDGTVLITGTNFGCGSSREHAPWALLDYGFRVIIAPSFADIFKNNCCKNGILPVILSTEVVEELMLAATFEDDYRLRINLEAQLVIRPDGVSCSFEIDDFQKNCMLKGIDEIGWTLQFESQIADYEAQSRI